jgi:hypothetical protein
MKKVKLANFNNPKWSYDDLKKYARKYRDMINEKDNVPFNIRHALDMYQSQPRDLLIERLIRVQDYLYK